MNKKRITIIILVLIIAILVGIIGYLVFVKKSQPIARDSDVSRVVTPTTSNSEKINLSSTTTLVSNTVKIVDKAGLYSVELPKDWKNIKSEGAMGAQISYITGESPDWKHREDNTGGNEMCTPYYYESGVSFGFHVSDKKYVLPLLDEGSVKTSAGLISKKKIVIDGVSGIYTVYDKKSSPCFMEGRVASIVVIYNNYGYDFQFRYADKYPQAETVFMNILNSIKFTK